MRKFLLGVCALMLLAALVTGAMASAGAVPNQSLALRTGPNTRYAWLDTMPETTAITAYEYEQGNGVTWVLVEYWKDGNCYRGYTGLKRMAVYGDIPWADHLNEDAWVNRACDVLAAPSEWGARRASLTETQWVSVLDYEGEYAYIEFYDFDADADSRGYVYSACLDDYNRSYTDFDYDGYCEYSDYDYAYDYGHDYLEGVTAVPNQQLALRGCPDNDTVWLGHKSQSTKILAYEYEQGDGVTWVLVEYWKNDLCYRGYTGLKRMTVYGVIPWANHLNESVQANWATTILAAPSVYGGYRGSLQRGDRVTLLEYDGDYAFIQFYESGEGRYNRGYVPAEAVQ